MQPHAPLTHADPFALPVQSTHAEAEPHAVADVPGMHVPVGPPQQLPTPQPPASHALVQAPPAQVGVTPAHAVQRVPVEPHCVSELPATHVVPLQHPPWHVRPPAHPAEHAPVTGSHASPAAQPVVVHEGGLSGFRPPSCPASCPASRWPSCPASWVASPTWPVAWSARASCPAPVVASRAPASTNDRSVTPTSAPHPVDSNTASTVAAQSSARPMLKSSYITPSLPAPVSALARATGRGRLPVAYMHLPMWQLFEQQSSP